MSQGYVKPLCRTFATPVNPYYFKIKSLGKKVCADEIQGLPSGTAYSYLLLSGHTTGQTDIH